MSYESLVVRKKPLVIKKEEKEKRKTLSE